MAYACPNSYLSLMFSVLVHDGNDRGVVDGAYRIITMFRYSLRVWYAGTLNWYSSSCTSELLHWSNLGLSALLHGSSAAEVKGEKALLMQFLVWTFTAFFSEETFLVFIFVYFLQLRLLTPMCLTMNDSCSLIILIRLQWIYKRTLYGGWLAEWLAVLKGE